MRLLTLSAAVLMPAALLAQAPAAPAYTAIYATESKSVPKDLAAFKEQEVLSRLAKVLSTPRPAFPKVGVDAFKKDFQGSVKSIYDAEGTSRAVASLHYLYSHALNAAGQWEKSAEALQQAIQVAREDQAAFVAATTPVAALFKEAADTIQAGKDKELEGPNGLKFKALQAADPAKRTPADQEFFAQFEAWVKGQEQNAQAQLDAGQKMQAMFKGAAEDIEKTAKVFETKLQDRQKKIKDQQDEIAKFLADQNAKIEKANAKVRNPKLKKELLSGPKAWVEAVISTPDNFSAAKVPSVEAKYQFLTRLNLLDPENKKVLAAMDNLKQGRDMFYKEPAAKKPAKKGTKKG